jgi:Cu(I)/Ag(I) efflux system membrane fusion protein/cobalt-zinc-cadmium efflux system membrane fusion protein
VSAAAGQPQIATLKNTITISTEPSPLARGKNKLRLTLKDAAGQPVSGAQLAVTFYLAAMPAMGMAALRAQASATDQGNGIYLGNIDLQSGGTWQMTIVATKGGQTIATQQSDVPVSGPMAM